MAFLALPETSPAASLVEALVQAGDMLHEHDDLLPKEFSAPLFAALCVGAELLLRAQAASAVEAQTAVGTASRRGER